MKTDEQKPTVPGWVGIAGVIFGLIAYYMAYLDGRERGSNRTEDVLDETGWEYEEWAASEHAVTDVRHFWLKVLGFTLLASVSFMLVLAVSFRASSVEYPLLGLIAFAIYFLAHIGSMCYQHGYYIGQNKSWEVEEARRATGR